MIPRYRSGVFSDCRIRTLITGLFEVDEGEGILLRTQAFLDQISSLKREGLSSQDALALASAWIGAATNHFLRSGSASATFAQKHDDAVMGFLSDILQLSATHAPHLAELAGLPVRQGGLGLLLATRRRPAAFLAAAETNLAELLRTLRLASDTELRAVAPGWDTAVRSAESAVRASGGNLDGRRWDWPETLDIKNRQKMHTACIFAGVRRALLGRLPLHARALFRGGGGPGAGAFLRPATSQELVVSEDAFLAYVRRRLLLPDPQLSGAVSCCRRGANGRVCCQPTIGDYGAHAVECHVGGAPLRRHTALAYTLAQWLKQKPGAHVSLEQWLPHLDRPRPDGQIVRARLDVVFVDSDGTQHIVDISVADALVANTSGELTRRASHDFANVTDRQREKHRRYRGPNIIAFRAGHPGPPGARGADALALRHPRQQ